MISGPSLNCEMSFDLEADMSSVRALREEVARARRAVGDIISKRRVAGKEMREEDYRLERTLAAREEELRKAVAAHKTELQKLSVEALREKTKLNTALMDKEAAIRRLEEERARMKRIYEEDQVRLQIKIEASDAEVSRIQALLQNQSEHEGEEQVRLQKKIEASDAEVSRTQALLQNQSEYHQNQSKHQHEEYRQQKTDLEAVIKKKEAVIRMLDEERLNFKEKYEESTVEATRNVAILQDQKNRFEEEAQREKQFHRRIEELRKEDRDFKEQALENLSLELEAQTQEYREAVNGHAPGDSPDNGAPIQPLTLQLESRNLSQLLMRAVGTVTPDCKILNVECVQDLPPDLGIFSIDEERLVGAFLHLLRNALSAMPDGGTLTVVCKDTPLGDAVEVTIRDTGNSSGAGRNHGIKGLTEARRVMEAHGGEISVECSAGEGKVVTVQLPR